MAHILQRAYALPAVTSLWQRQAGHSYLLALSQLATHARPIYASSCITSLRDWHANQQRRQLCSTSRARSRVSAAATSAATSSNRHKVVFLGTPEVAADVLYKLIQASKQEDCTYKVVATVTQPGKSRRGSKGPDAPPPPPSRPSPVALMAADLIPSKQLLAPKSAKDEEFLAAVRELQPDLCVTAAYGNILPKEFLKIPKFGTVNIHPSLLPKYRGAAPVQRAVQNGEKQVGVCLLYTVQKMDAGPIIAQETVDVDDGIQAHELLHHLFSVGTRLLLDNLEAIWSGEAEQQAKAQTGTPSVAPKLDRRESKLDWSDDARTIHNKVRAFAPWPGTTHTFQKVSESGLTEALPLKILKTELCQQSDWPEGNADERVAVEKKAIYVKCGDGNILSLRQLQIPGKKPVDPVAFINGLNGRTLHLYGGIEELCQ